MPPRSRRTRSYDPARTRAALLAQADAVRDAVAGLDAAAHDRPTRLGDWTVRELVVHLALEVEALPRALAEEPPRGPADLTPPRWALSTADQAGRPAAGARAAAAGTPDPPARLAAAVEALRADLAAPLPDRLVRTPAGTLPAADFAVTRLVGLVVHADDLTAAGVPVALERPAVAAAARLLADALAEKAPGGSVEVRVPPYAAVQCVPGPRHTRGTPPNVVETDPLTWIRLACGRTGWAAAVHDALVSASGERADLSAYLPVLG